MHMPARNPAGPDAAQKAVFRHREYRVSAESPGRMQPGGVILFRYRPDPALSLASDATTVSPSTDGPGTQKLLLSPQGMQVDLLSYRFVAPPQIRLITARTARNYLPHWLPLAALH